MDLMLCTYRGVTVGSLMSWVFSMSDFYSDVAYYQTVPKSNAFLQYALLFSLVFPPILNFLWLSWKIGKKESFKDGICGGLKYTVGGLLGIHELVIVTRNE